MPRSLAFTTSTLAIQIALESRKDRHIGIPRYVCDVGLGGFYNTITQYGLYDAEDTFGLYKCILTRL